MCTAVKTSETIYYPDILELQDQYFAPELQEKRQNIRKAEESKNIPKEEKKTMAKTKNKKGKMNSGVEVKVIEQSEETKEEMMDYKHLEKYELIGTIVHKGTSAVKGHYITFIKDSYGNWLLYDDKQCKQVSSNLVLDQQAYILIYRKF